MTDYAVLLPDDEQAWTVASADRRREVYERHTEFIRLLAERGHTLVGGAELRPSTAARIVRGSRDHVTVTDGPYAESAEQLSGFYKVSTDDLEDLLQLCGILAESTAGTSAVEVRPCVSGDDRPEQVSS